MQLDSFVRWSNWMLLEHGPAIHFLLESLWAKYDANRSKFTSNKVYVGCGHDVGVSRYEDWDLCDVREIPGVILWDILMGLPQEDTSMDAVKSKLTLGMLTLNQAKFLLHEAARVLSPGGVFELTFRDFNLLLKRLENKEIDRDLFVRYVYGSGQYFGSRRKSCWTASSVEKLAKEFGFKLSSSGFRGMNSTFRFTRTNEKLKKFGPEPKVLLDENGVMINDGGDFPSERRM